MAASASYNVGCLFPTVVFIHCFLDLVVRGRAPDVLVDAVPHAAAFSRDSVDSAYREEASILRASQNSATRNNGDEAVERRAAPEVRATLRFEPPTLELFDEPTCIPLWKAVEIFNHGEGELIIDAVSSDNHMFHPSFKQGLPVRVGAGESATMKVLFLPQAVETVEAVLSIQTSVGTVLFEQGVVFGIGLFVRVSWLVCVACWAQQSELNGPPITVGVCPPALTFPPRIDVTGEYKRARLGVPVSELRVQACCVIDSNPLPAPPSLKFLEVEKEQWGFFVLFLWFCISLIFQHISCRNLFSYRNECCRTPLCQPPTIIYPSHRAVTFSIPAFVLFKIGAKRYHAQARSVPNPFGVNAVLGQHVPSAMLFAPPIVVHNPSESEDLHILEVFTTENFLHLSFPEWGDIGGDVRPGRPISQKDAFTAAHASEFWTIPPGQSKAIIFLAFTSENPGLFQGFVHIRMDRHSLLVPVTINVIKGGLHFSPAVADFHTLVTPSQSR